jgi:outer membrane protein insertion porin family
LYAKEKGTYAITTGTEAGAAEGSAYANVVLRNIFGGAESFTAHAARGTRTRSVYSANFNTPILSNPDLRFELGGLASAVSKSFASHEEVLRGGSSKLKWVPAPGHFHEFAYSGLSRQVTSLAQNASQTVIGDAGDSFKSSFSHTWINEQRDYPLLPSSGYFMKTFAELAGYGPLKGDVAFAKLEAETQTALPLSQGVSLTAGLRGGLLYPLTLNGESLPSQSRVNDRFQLGGPTDVRGFRLSGLGPRDGPDAVGGDVYAAGGASLFFPIPKCGPETPLRFQAFVNGGRLLALQGSSKGHEPVDSDAVKAGMKNTIRELMNGVPTTSAGFGLVYAHPAARFELNFSLPLYIRKGEEGRKGLTFGVGISFL